MGANGASNIVSWSLESSGAKCKFCSNVRKIDCLTNCQNTCFQQSSREGKGLGRQDRRRLAVQADHPGPLRGPDQREPVRLPSRLRLPR
uniref:Uncharacterized protein n=1 Tax=Arundo donax TaxID=35708 RepID=A0A0A9GJP6_ARUDO